MKVLVADLVDEEGIEILRRHAEVDIKPGLKPQELIDIIDDYEALVVRSQTQVTADVIAAGKKLQVIARAGVGVDNIDVEAATRRGTVVVNAPIGNTTAAAEHAVALMLALARHTPQANATLKAGVWRRNDFMGTEVRNKTLGIIGLGNVGSEVAKRAQGLQMKIVAHDPFVSIDHARNLQVELVSLPDLMKVSDFITIHVPLTQTTRGCIGAQELALAKPTLRIINTARGGLIDEEALVKALHEKRIAGAAFDVFTTEPITDSILFKEDSIIVTPHLGASTTEAQATVARDVAEQVVAIFEGQPARYAVNAPFIAAETLPVLMPFITAARAAGRLASQLADGQMNSITIEYDGEISNYDTNALKVHALGGVLEEISEERVTAVNANILAARRGLAVVEKKESSCENYASLLTVGITTSTGTHTVGVTVMRGETHIVRVDDYWIDIVPTGGYFLFADHLDRPGILGAVGQVTGDADINISAMHVGRLKPRGQALMVLALDEPLPEEIRKKILAIPDIYSAKLGKV
jgi:D-3-phosphoglycerate dehydrogenase